MELLDLDRPSFSEFKSMYFVPPLYKEKWEGREYNSLKITKHH